MHPPAPPPSPPPPSPPPSGSAPSGSPASVAAAPGPALTTRGQPQLPRELLTVLATWTDPEPIARLLSDLLTPQELEALAERWWIAERLSRGEAQRAVSEALQVSITTVSRGARSLKYGAGGFDLALRTLRGLEAARPDDPTERR